MKNLKPILLVDDSEQDVELTVMGLKQGGGITGDIDVTYDGEEALDYLYRRGKYRNRPEVDPAVILLDLKMPKVDGFEVLRTLKEDKRLSHIPVVVFSSSRENRDIVKSYGAGANAYVVKPLDSLQFMNTIKQLGLFWVNVNMVPA